MVSFDLVTISSQAAKEVQPGSPVRPGEHHDGMCCMRSMVFIVAATYRNAIAIPVIRVNKKVKKKGKKYS